MQSPLITAPESSPLPPQEEQVQDAEGRQRVELLHEQLVCILSPSVSIPSLYIRELNIFP